MIEKLEELTVARFIDLACGDTSVLHGKHEVVSPFRLAVAMRNILYEFKSIADLSGTVSYLSRLDELWQAQLSLSIFSIGMELLKVEEYESVRKIISEYGINSAKMSDRRLIAEVKSRYERARHTINKIQESISGVNPEKDNVRRSFDEQTANLMAYFKFQIDVMRMKATIYAHLIARQDKEMKAQMSALKNK